MANDLIAQVRTWKGFLAALRRTPAKIRYAAGFGVLGIMKNEAMNLDEWIEHYLWMGAGRIYLIDNGSTDDTVEKARAWVAKGKVKLVEYPERYKQEQHYRTAFRHFRIDQYCRWLLVADLDEFWFCPAGDSLDTALKEFGRYDVVYSNWVNFGSAGRFEHPESVREGFVLRRPGVAGHNESKYFCRTSVIRDGALLGIHKVQGADSARTISDTQRFQLNHYPIQSESFFRAVKMTRGASDSAKHEHVRDMDYFRRYDEGCDMPDRALADLVAAARMR